jgi:uncharacterized membrane protein YdjX (TVP38/TMEM64 family)
LKFEGVGINQFTMRFIKGSLPVVLFLTVLSLDNASGSKITTSSPQNKRSSLLHLSVEKAWTPLTVDNKALVTLRGGGGGKDSVVEESNKLKHGTTGVVIVTSMLLVWTSRASWMGLFDKEQLLAKTLSILHELNSLPKHYSYTVYTLGMAFWESLGLSTIPVETAAGMVFGWHGFWLSAIGKLLGAVLAFSLARYGILAELVQRKLADNSFLQLLQDSAESNPLLVSILLKFSCFPETIKNYGSAILKPIRLWMFVFGTVFHGWTFSALWTYLGVDTAMRLEDPSIPADTLLGTLLSLALVNGVVVSPLAMTYWVRNLKKTAKKKDSRKQAPKWKGFKGKR